VKTVETAKSPKKQKFIQRMRDLSVMVYNAICVTFDEWRMPLDEEKVIECFRRLYPHSEVTIDTFRRRFRELRQKGLIRCQCRNGRYFDIVPVDKGDQARRVWKISSWM